MRAGSVALRALRLIGTSILRAAPVDSMTAFRFMTSDFTLGAAVEICPLTGALACIYEQAQARVRAGGAVKAPTLRQGCVEVVQAPLADPTVGARTAEELRSDLSSALQTVAALTPASSENEVVSAAMKALQLLPLIGAQQLFCLRFSPVDPPVSEALF